VPLVIALAAVAVLAAVVILAMGHGGELAEARRDRPPALLPWNRPVEGTDIALLRLPTGVWGYHIGTTDEVLTRLAHAVGERTTRIAVLEGQLAELRARLAARSDAGAPEVSWDAPQQPPSPWPPSDRPPAGPPPSDLPPPGGPRSAGSQPAGPPQQWGSHGPGQVVFGPYGTSDHVAPDYLDTDR
jgi:hypothetical protein